MQILLIARCPPYPIHLGDRLIIYHLARELSARGHSIDLLAFANTAQDWADHPWDDPQVRPYFRDVEIFPEPRRSQLAYLKRALLSWSRFPHRADQSWSPDMWRAIERKVAQTSYDIVHLFGGVQVYEFQQAVGALPAVITPYESYSLYLRRMVETQKLNANESNKGFKPLVPNIGTQGLKAQLWMAQRFEQFMFTPYPRTVVVSERDKEELLGINPALRIEIIPNGIDLNYFQPQDVPREPATLLFTGNYEYAPNVDAARRLAADLLPRVQARLQSRGIGLKLWLVGNAPPPELQALDSESIRVTGRVPDIRPYLAQATLFVSPLRLGAGIKNKVLEALAMGLPVVATPLSVDGIAVQHEQEAWIADDDAALVDGIVRLLQDEALRVRLSARGCVLIQEHYSWAHTAQRYEGLYQQVVR